MWTSTEQFIGFSEPMEGIVDWMYPDSEGYVTIGLGNKIDDEASALGLPGLGAATATGARQRRTAGWSTSGSRNAMRRNRGLFRNAAWAREQRGYEPGALWFPIGSPRPLLKRGAQDQPGAPTYVADAQFFLDWLGYSVAQTGAFDDETVAVVQRFQTDEQFPATGQVGSLTWAALGYGVS